MTSGLNWRRERIPESGLIEVLVEMLYGGGHFLRTAHLSWHEWIKMKMIIQAYDVQ